MADTKTSALSAIAAVVDATEFPANDAGTTKKVTGLQIKAYIGDSLGNQATADQVIPAATLTYITKSNIAVPVGKLRIGTVFTWHITMTKTAAGTAARTFDVRIGTAGTTADTSRLSFLTGVGTAAVDVGLFDIIMTVRGPLSASGIVSGDFRMVHGLAATGFLTQALNSLQATSSAFDVTTANLIVGLSVTGGAAEAMTITQVVAEAQNL